MAPPRAPRVSSDQTVADLLPVSQRGHIPVLPRSPKSLRFRVAISNENGGPDATPIFDEHHYARLNGELVINVPNGSSQLALPGPATLRNMLQFRNASASANVYISFGAVASLNSLLKLAAGDQILYDVVVPQDDVFVYGDAASAVLIIGSSTTPGRSS